MCWYVHTLTFNVVKLLLLWNILIKFEHSRVHLDHFWCINALRNYTVMYDIKKLLVSQKLRRAGLVMSREPGSCWRLLLAAGVVRSGPFLLRRHRSSVWTGRRSWAHWALSTGDHLIVLSSRDSVIVATQVHFYFGVFPSSQSRAQRSEWRHSRTIARSSYDTILDNR